MSPELDKKLCEKYPLIFRNRISLSSENVMGFGFDCGDGWYDIIDNLCEAANHAYFKYVKIDQEDGEKLLIQRSKIDNNYYLEVPAPTMVADQVKEKFAYLRFYYHLEFEQNIEFLIESGKYPDLNEIVSEYHSFFDGIIHMAEILSIKTCEETGQKGEIHVSGDGIDGWYKTLNPEFAKTDQRYIHSNYVPIKNNQ